MLDRPIRPVIHDEDDLDVIKEKICYALGIQRTYDWDRIISEMWYLKNMYLDLKRQSLDVEE